MDAVGRAVGIARNIIGHAQRNDRKRTAIHAELVGGVVVVTLIQRDAVGTETAYVECLEREADELEARARALRQIVAGVRELNGDAGEITDPRFVEQNGTVFVASALDKNGPRGREAVARVMGENPHKTWKVIELKREILRRGWAPTPKAVEANLKRMRELGEVESPRYGYYRLADDTRTEKAASLMNLHCEEDEGT